MTVQNLDTQHMAQKHIRLNSDVITFNKNTRWYFSALCTLRMSQHSGHYCIVMYKCKSMFLWQLYVQALLWLTKLPDEDPVPPGNWPKLHSSSLPLPSSPSQEEAADCWLPRRSRWVQLFLHCGAELNLTSSFLKINIILKKKDITRWLGVTVHVISRHRINMGRDFFGQGNLVLWTNKEDLPCRRLAPSPPPFLVIQGQRARLL